MLHQPPKQSPSDIATAPASDSSNTGTPDADAAVGVAHDATQRTVANGLCPSTDATPPDPTWMQQKNETDPLIQPLSYTPTSEGTESEPHNEDDEFQEGEDDESHDEDDADSEDEEYEVVPAESLMDGDDAAAALATFSTSEHMMFWQMLEENASPQTAQWVRSVLSQFLAQREPTNQEMMTMASAAAIQVPPELAERARREARADAEANVKAAMESIIYAQQILQASGGDGIADLQRAMELLQADTDPLAQGAAQAQQLVHQLLLNCPAGAQRAVKKADRDMRDIVMLRCRAVCIDPKDRDDFLGRAAEAYGGGELDKEVRAQLLLSYHKDCKNKKCGFVSNNQIAADRRGGPRPRHRRQKAGEKKEASAASSGTTPPAEHQDTGGASSSCAAAAEPMYVPVQELWEKPKETDEGYLYVSNASPELQQVEQQGHMGSASRAMLTASSASHSWETPLVFYEAEQIVPGSMADNDAKSLVQKFGRIKPPVNIDKPKPQGLNPEADEKVVPVKRRGRGEAGRDPVAIDMAYQADYATHQAAFHQGQLAAYAQYYEMMQQAYEMMQQEHEEVQAMQSWNVGGQPGFPRGQAKAAGSGGSKPPGSKP